MKTTLLAAAVAALPLAACVTVSGETVSKYCTAANLAHAAFIGLSAQFDVPEHIIEKEAVAFVGVQEICSDPSAFENTSSAIKAIGEAIAAIGEATAEAEAAVE